MKQVSQQIWLTFIVAAVLVVGIASIIYSGAKPAIETPIVATPPTDDVSNGRVKMYGLEEIAKHDSEESCWTAVDGNVYDLTEWINRHPGGERAILSICGIDGTQTFRGMHQTDDAPSAMLASFKIGELGQ